MKTLALALVGLFFISSAVAETDESTPKFSTKTSPKKLKLNQPVGDIDKDIKSDYLRAKSGSKNRWSASFDVAYRGGPLSDPFPEERPSIYDDVAFESRTAISGNIYGRYRMSKHDSLSLGTGMTLYTPFHGDTDKDDSQLDVSTPSVSYSRVYRWRWLQNITTISGSYATTDSAEAIDYLGDVTISQNALTMLGKWTLGATIGYSQMIFGNKRAHEFDRFGPQKDGLLDRMVMISPYASYQFAPKWTVRTFISTLNYYHRRGTEDKSLFRMEKGADWATLGLSYSLTRDIYLYPNVLFDPDNVDFDRTHVGFSTTINL